ncbi:MAG: XdhC/CoxI family protein, partial [Chloroflexi bacterium]|nr:XdhC/CoxI family protein [Chloroflexota bacterium]
ELYRAVLDTLEHGEAVAVATVTKASGSVPRGVGSKMLVWRDGTIDGTVGGGTMEERVIQEARDAIVDGRPRYREYLFTSDAENSVGLCGGQAEVFIEVVRPRQTLLLVGAGHISHALAKIAALNGYRVVVADDRPEFLDDDRFPDAEQRIHVRYERESERLDPMVLNIDAATHVVVATWGWDEPALVQVLQSPAPYIGLVSSRRKFKLIADKLRERGCTDEDIARIHAPIGLDIGAETPEEIAVAIMAEIIMQRRGGDGAPIYLRWKPKAARRQTADASPQTT